MRNCEVVIVCKQDGWNQRLTVPIMSQLLEVKAIWYVHDVWDDVIYKKHFTNSNQIDANYLGKLLL